MKGVIVVNKFGLAAQDYQARRIEEELNKIGVKTSVVSDGAEKSALINGRTATSLQCDFCVFLDKDKYLSAILSSCGIRLFNSHEAIRKCDDKGETYIALANEGFNLPETYFAPLKFNSGEKTDNSFVLNIGEKLGFPVVVKESYGSMGTGVFLAKNADELSFLSNKLALKPHLYQKYLAAQKGVDIRIIVIGGKAVSCIKRFNPSDFRSNLALGGFAEKINPPKEFILAAEKAAAVLKLDYCGVDVLFGDKNEPVICEVNSNAFFKGSESVTGINIAEIYAEHIYKSVKYGREK